MRIRTIKPEIYADEKVSRWCFQDRLLFIGLISLADDYGIIRNQPKLIAGTIFPEDEDIGSRDIHEALMRLSEDGPVVLYKVSGVSYIALRNWSKHQKVQHPGKAKLPHPTEEALRPLVKPSRESHETLIKSSPPIKEQGTGNRELNTPPNPQGNSVCDGLVYWNEQTGQKRRGVAIKKSIQARVKEFSLDAVKQVVDWAVSSRDERAQFLRGKGLEPETIFRAGNFEKYLERSNKDQRVAKAIERSTPDGWVGPALGANL